MRFDRLQPCRAENRGGLVLAVLDMLDMLNVLDVLIEGSGIEIEVEIAG